MEFAVVDVETANSDISSICQIGIATFRDGDLAEAWASLVNPRDYFDSVNVSIHGITEEQVENAPIWADIFPEIAVRLKGRIVVSHMPFDRAAMTRACQRCSLEIFECRWLDSARVVRRTWPIFSKSGYGLSNVAAYLGISYCAHDALEDARCAGLVMLRAIAQTGYGPEQWLVRILQPLHSATESHTREGNPEGALFGEVLVFTGELSMSRAEAADLAATAGCRVDSGITKQTTILALGDQNFTKLAAQEKSSKHRKAEQLISKGQSIRILRETDFRQIIASCKSVAI